MTKILLTSGSTTAIIDTLGAEMKSFKGSDGREVIWQGDPAIWAGSAPVLFPICGMAKDDRITIDDVSYPIAKHGFCRYAVFSVARQGDDFVDLVLTASDETRAQYPFEFAFHIVYTLRENGFRTDYVIENHSDRVMPFCVGGHPAFNVPMEDGTSYTDYRLVFPFAERGKNLLVPGGGMVDGFEYYPLENGTTLKLTHDLFADRDTLLFDEFRSRSVKLVHKDTGKGIHFRYPKMEMLAIWSMPLPNSNYVCLEPWHGIPGQVTESGRFEDKPYATLLAPGRAHQCGYDVELL